MDEESPKKKISVNSFFEKVDSVEKVASSALSKSDSVMNVANANKLLVESLQLTVETMQTEIKEIANYIVIEKKLEKDLREDRLLEEQDAQQKKDISEKFLDLKAGPQGPKGPQGVKGEDFGGKGGGGSLLGGLLKGLATLGAGAFALKFMWPALLPLIKSALGSAVGGGIKFLGGAVGKTLIGILGGIPIVGAAAKLIGGGIEKTADKAGDGLESAIKNMGEDGKVDIKSSGDEADEGSKSKESKYEKLVDAGYEFDDKGMVGGQRVIDYKGPDDGKRTKFSKGLAGFLGIGNRGRYERVQSEGGTKTLLGEGSGDSLEDIINRDESIQLPKGRSFGSRFLGGIDALTGNLTDFDQEGGKTFGGGRILGGLIDAATGNLTDIDKEGGKTFGTTRVMTGIMDAMTGNKYDLDKRGSGIKPVLESENVGSLETPDKVAMDNSTNVTETATPPSPTVNDNTALVQASSPQVSSAMIKPTEAPIPFRKLISSKKYLSVSDMSKSGLPPEIAKMIS